MAEISIRDLIVKRLAVKMRINETDVDAVITHQFKGIVQALKTEDTVEIAGFGKFVLSRKRANRMLDALTKQVEEHLATGKPFPMKRTLPVVQQEIELLKNRLYGDKTITDNRGSNQSHL